MPNRLNPHLMHDKQRFQLIDGTFSPSKAGQVLHSLVQSKIDYHSLQKLSDLVRLLRFLGRRVRGIEYHGIHHQRLPCQKAP